MWGPCQNKMEVGAYNSEENENYNNNVKIFWIVQFN